MQPVKRERCAQREKDFPTAHRNMSGTQEDLGGIGWESQHIHKGAHCWGILKYIAVHVCFSLKIGLGIQ